MCFGSKFEGYIKRSISNFKIAFELPKQKPCIIILEYAKKSYPDLSMGHTGLCGPICAHLSTSCADTGPKQSDVSFFCMSCVLSCFNLLARLYDV